MYVHVCPNSFLFPFWNHTISFFFFRHSESLFSSLQHGSLRFLQLGFRCECRGVGELRHCNQAVEAYLYNLLSHRFLTSSSSLKEEVFTSIIWYHPQGSEHMFSPAPGLFFPPPFPLAACLRLHPLSQNASLCHNEMLGGCAAPMSGDGWGLLYCPESDVKRHCIHGSRLEKTRRNEEPDNTQKPLSK